MNGLTQDDQQVTTSAAANVNVFDYQVSSFSDAMESGQEMQERDGRALLGQGSTAGPVQYSPGTNTAWNQ